MVGHARPLPVTSLRRLLPSTSAMQKEGVVGVAPEDEGSSSTVRSPKAGYVTRPTFHMTSYG